MTGLRLLQLAKDLNITIDTVVSALAANGIYVESKPTTKLSDEEVKIAITSISSSSPKTQELLNSHSFSTNSKATTFAKLESIRRSKGKPKSFYKFFGTQDYNLACLSEGYIYLTHPSYFNDPFDCSLDLVDFSDTIQKNFNKKAVNRFRSRLDNIGVCCFSRENNSILMWSHYANSHRGFCCEFISDSNDIHGLHPLDVCYSDGFSKLNFHGNTDDAIANMMYTKSIYWEYEQELRILGHDLNKPEDRKKKYTQKDLKSVFLGVSCEAKTVDFIKACLKDKYPDTKLFQARKSSNLFKIELEQIHVPN